MIDVRFILGYLVAAPILIYGILLVLSGAIYGLEFGSTLGLLGGLAVGFTFSGSGMSSALALILVTINSQVLDKQNKFTRPLVALYWIFLLINISSLILILDGHTVNWLSDLRYSTSTVPYLFDILMMFTGYWNLISLVIFLGSIRPFFRLRKESKQSRQLNATA